MNAAARGSLAPTPASGDAGATAPRCIWMWYQRSFLILPHLALQAEQVADPSRGRPLVQASEGVGLPSLEKTLGRRLHEPLTVVPLVASGGWVVKVVTHFAVRQGDVRAQVQRNRVDLLHQVLLHRLEEGRALGNVDSRGAIFKAMQKYLVEQVYSIPLYLRSNI